MPTDHRQSLWASRFSIKDLLMATVVVSIGLWLLVDEFPGSWVMLNLVAPAVIGVGLFLPFKRKFLGGSLGCLVFLVIAAIWILVS